MTSLEIQLTVTLAIVFFIYALNEIRKNRESAELFERERPQREMKFKFSKDARLPVVKIPKDDLQDSLMTTFVLKYKCMNCALEFVVYTNVFNEWENKTPYCPECGINYPGSKYFIQGESSPKAISSLIHKRHD